MSRHECCVLRAGARKAREAWERGREVSSRLLRSCGDPGTIQAGVGMCVWKKLSCSLI